MKKIQKYILGLLTPLSLGCVPEPKRCDYMSEKNNPVCRAYFDVAQDVQVDSMRGRNHDDLEQVVQDTYQIDDVLRVGTDIIREVPLDSFIADYEGNNTVFDTSLFNDVMNVEVADSIFTTDEIVGKLEEANVVDETTEISIDSFISDSATDVVYSDSLDAMVEVSIDIPIPQNTKPVFTPLGNKSVAEGQKLVLQILASDADNDTIVYTILANAVAGTTFNAKTGQFTFTPEYTFVTHPNIVKSTSFTFGAFDGKEYAEPLTVQVNVQDTNRLLAISSTPLLEAMVDAPYSYKIVATDEDMEDVLLYTLVNSPVGMSLKDTIVSWKPTKDQAGKQALEIAVTDGIDTVKQSVMIEVKEQVCYSNSFDNANSLQDIVIQNGKWSWNMQGFLEQTEVGGGWRMAYISGKDFGDFQASLKVRMISSSCGDEHTGLLFRYNQKSDKGYDSSLDKGYALEIVGESYLALEDVNQTYIVPKKSVSPSGGKIFGDWHELKVKVVGENITGYIDGQENFSINDIKYKAGKLGFGSHCTTSQFKDLQVCPL